MKKWIQPAIKHKGALKQSIKRKYGNKAFTDRGTIKMEYLNKAAKQPGKMGQRARLAKTLRKMK